MLQQSYARVRTPYMAIQYKDGELERIKLLKILQVHLFGFIYGYHLLLQPEQPKYKNLLAKTTVCMCVCALHRHYTFKCYCLHG